MRLLNRKVPGAGVVLTAVVITFVGFSRRTSPRAGSLQALEELLEHTPLVKLPSTPRLKDIGRGVRRREEEVQPPRSASR